MTRGNFGPLWKRIRVDERIHDDAKICRHIQIFNGICNSFQQDCFVVLIIGILVLISTSLCLLVQFGSVREVPMLLS